MAQSKADKLAEIFETARREFDRAVSATEDQREESLEDRRFATVAGAQWEGASYTGAFENRPKLEMNKVNMAVMRVLNEYRANRITVDFVPKNGRDDDELADLCDGLYRADEADSRAQEAYDTAFDEAASGGFGSFRLCAEYEDEYDEDEDEQRIRFEPIPDADKCVFFDPNAKRQDKSDARYCFVLTFFTNDAYEEEFGETPSDWGAPITDVEFDWSTPDGVYVAEYYKVVDERYRVFKFRDVSGEEIKIAEEDLTPEKAAEFNSTGTIQIGEKMVKRRRIRKYIMSGGGILEDAGFIAGDCIPIIPVYGKRWIIDGAERWAGVVRYAKDPQRLYNMQLSSLAEVAARGGHEKPIVAPEQVAGVEHIWAEDSKENYAYLPLNPIRDSAGNELFQGPLDYTRAPQVPAPTAALLPIVDQDMKDVLGNQQAGEEVDAQLSGKAVELIQTRLDQQTVIYMTNFASALRRSGEVWLGMARDLYVEEGRSMKWVGNGDEMEEIKINTGNVFDQSGEVVKENDLKRAKFDVKADVGPTSSSKRSATVRALTGMMQFIQDPADATVVTAAVMMNMEGEGIKSVREYFRRKLVQMGVEEPTEEEQQQMAMAQQAGSQPDPQTLALIEGAKAQAQRDITAARENEADTVEALARAEKLRAETAKTLSEVDNSQRDSVMNAVKTLREAGTVPPQTGAS